MLDDRGVDHAGDAALVYAAQWLVPLFLAPATSWLFNYNSPRLVLIACELGGVLLVCLIGSIEITGITAIFPLLVVRGLIDVAVKSGRLIVLRLQFPGERLKQALSINSTSFVIGLAVAGLMASAIVHRLDLWSVALISSGCFALAAVAYASLNLSAASKEMAVGEVRPSWWRQLSVLRVDHLLRRRFMLFCLLVATMQGYHMAARTVFPIRDLGMDASGPAWLQSIAIAGVLLGSIMVALTVGGERVSKIRDEVIGLAGYAMMLATWLFASPMIALGFYFVFMCLHEIVFVRLSADVMADCPMEAVPAVSVAMTSGSLGGMTLFTILAGWGADFAGMANVCLAISGMGGLLLMASLMVPVPRSEGRA
ncbi:MFS transporter [Nisaea sp.]|uniref:MFS transporter n=1 Tax=Nisaea sp. TaxID=2024842 RepID=UPI002B26E92C|nr:MFS transporter [Nisaea sp.]